MINSIKEDKELLAFVDSDIRDLGILSYPREPVVQALRNGEGLITIEGQHEFSEYDQQQLVDYSIALKQYIAPNYYHPITLFARIADEPDKMQIFKLTGGGYFTLNEAVNLLNGRPVAKKELVGRKIQECWFSLDPGSKDIYGSSAIVKSALSDEQLLSSIDQAPIKEGSLTNKQKLISQLKMGALIPVTLLKDGIEVKAFAMANAGNKVVVVKNGKQNTNQSKSNEQRKSRGGIRG